MNISLMQGRLSFDYDNQFQFFPKDWRSEAVLAKFLGFEGVEWLLDWRGDAGENPLISDTIGLTSHPSPLPIHSVCADYFMKNDLLGRVGNRLKVFEMLESISAACVRSNIPLLVIPFLESLKITQGNDLRELNRVLSQWHEDSRWKSLRIALETELTGNQLRHFFDITPQLERIGVCYDLGNCTSYGFNCPEEIRLLGEKVFEVHLKDRKVGTSQSVYLGAGDVPWPDCFKALQDIDFSGNLVLQAFRGLEYLDDAIRQLHFIKEVAHGVIS